MKVVGGKGGDGCVSFVRFVCTAMCHVNSEHTYIHECKYALDSTSLLE